MTLIDFGTKLRTLREDQGLTLQDVTEKIKIATRIIESIESGDRDSLPHTVYAKGFITSYATLLGMDQEELQENIHILFDYELPEEPQTVSGSLGKSTRKKIGSLKPIYLSLLLFAILAGALAVWQGERYKIPRVDLLEIVKKPFIAVSDKPNSPTLEVKNKQKVVKNKKEVEPVKKINKEEKNIKANKDIKGEREDKETSETDPEKIQEKSISAEVVSTEKESSTPLVEPKAQHIVHIEVIKEQCWVASETDKEGEVSEMLNAGDSKEYPYNKTFRIILGNPGAITLSHDGVQYYKKLNGSRREILQFP